MRLQGSRILVTGGARGMGLEIARLAASKGADTAIWDVDERRLPEVLTTVRDAVRGPEQRVATAAVDVSDRAAVMAAARELEADFGPVDLLVNNAGVVSGKPLLDLAPEAIERTFRVNALALFWTTQAFLPGMIQRGRGHLVTLASAAGLLGAPGMSDYSASKYAAVGYHEALRAELRRRAPGIGTTLVCPYFVDTGMFAGVRTRFPFLLPILRPEAVAAAVARGVEQNRRVVILPWFVHSLKLIRLLPAAWLDPIAAFFGIHSAMDSFTGRPTPSPPRGDRS